MKLLKVKIFAIKIKKSKVEQNKLLWNSDLTLSNVYSRFILVTAFPSFLNYTYSVYISMAFFSVEIVIIDTISRFFLNQIIIWFLAHRPLQLNIIVTHDLLFRS